MNCKKTILISLFTIGILFLTNTSIINAIAKIEADNIFSDVGKKEKMKDKTDNILYRNPNTCNDIYRIFSGDDPICFGLIKGPTQIITGKEGVWSFWLWDDEILNPGSRLVDVEVTYPNNNIHTISGSFNGFGAKMKFTYDFKHPNNPSVVIPGQYKIKIIAKDAKNRKGERQSSSYTFYVNVYQVTSPPVDPIPTVTQSCTRSKPTISVSPTIKSTEKGKDVSFNVFVKNTDTNCSERKINLSVTGSSLTYRFSPSSLADSGGSSTLTFTIPSYSEYTTYSPSIKATNAYDTSKSSSKSVSIKVAEISDIQIKDSNGNIIPSQNDWNYNLPFNSQINISWKTKNISLSRIIIWLDWLDGNPDVRFFTIDTSLGSGSINFTLPTNWVVGKTGKIIIEDFSEEKSEERVTRIRQFTIISSSIPISPCIVRQTPTVSVSPSSQSGNPGQTLTYTLSVKNNDLLGCKKSTFTSLFTSTSSFLSYPTLSSLTIAPNETKTTTFNITISSSAPSDNYLSTIKTTNSNAPNYFSSASFITVVPITPITSSVSNTTSLLDIKDQLASISEALSSLSQVVNRMLGR